jgi:hypothetical protein
VPIYRNIGQHVINRANCAEREMIGRPAVVDQPVGRRGFDAMHTEKAADLCVGRVSMTRLLSVAFTLVLIATLLAAAYIVVTGSS